MTYAHMHTIRVVFSGYLKIVFFCYSILVCHFLFVMFAPTGKEHLISTKYNMKAKMARKKLSEYIHL